MLSFNSSVSFTDVTVVSGLSVIRSLDVGGPGRRRRERIRAGPDPDCWILRAESEFRARDVRRGATSLIACGAERSVFYSLAVPRSETDAEGTYTRGRARDNDERRLRDPNRKFYGREISFATTLSTISR